MTACGSLARRPIPDGTFRDDDGELRLIQHVMCWEAYVHLAFDEIRLAGAGSPQVARRLRPLCSTSSIAPEDRRGVLEEELDLLSGAPPTSCWQKPTSCWRRPRTPAAALAWVPADWTRRYRGPDALRWRIQLSERAPIGGSGGCDGVRTLDGRSAHLTRKMRKHGVMTNPALGYDRVGSGEPLLLLHGFGSTRDDFAALLPELARSYDVLAVDLPGHGSSPMIDGPGSVRALTEAVIADLDAHGLDRVHVLGNSLGARLAIELARRGRALSVVAISPSGLGAPLERMHQGALMITARMINQARRPWIDQLAATPAGRTVLLAGMRPFRGRRRWRRR